MVSGADPHALTRLLYVFVSGSRLERVELAKLQGSSRKFFSDSLDISIRLLVAGGEAYRANASVATLIRLIWSLVPSRLLNSASPDFRLLAEKALRSRFGEFPGFDESARLLCTVFKRIRQYALTGRRAQSLNLELTSHQNLMNKQAWRCAHCYYEFKADDYLYAAEEDGVAVEVEAPIEGELLLASLPRRPELDHIVPLILGGDGFDNWQILCRSCNVGKSDQVIYLAAVAGQTYNRVGHLFELTQGKRYAVIAEAAPSVNFSSGDRKHFRIFKIDELGFSNPENLHAVYC